MSEYQNFDILKFLHGLLKGILNNYKNDHKKEKYLIIAKNKYFADLFIQENGIDPKQCEFVGHPENLHGLSGWIVCFVPGYWHHSRSMDIEEIAEHLIYQGFLDESEKFNKAYAWSH